MKNITFLGPVGATFSHDAYNILAIMYKAPKVTNENCIPAASNGEILKIIGQHGGYGAIAMETLAEGRVAEPLESFIDLLRDCKDNNDCPFGIIGALRLKIHFCLMARKGIPATAITKIIAHPKALGACKEKIIKMGITTINAPSNGEAARLVAENSEYAECGALGPVSATEKYGLTIHEAAFEDGEAITTFFLIGPKEHKVSLGKENRILIVFKVPHTPGALVKSLLPFEQEDLNLIQIHSVHAGNHTYNFAIEVEVSENRLETLNRAMKVFTRHVETYLSFGPFEILSR